jgi:hypothetical protein
MLADVSLTQGAEQRIDERVQQYVGVRMADKLLAMGNCHAAQDELSPAAQAVGVEAVADTKLPCHRLNCL